MLGHLSDPADPLLNGFKVSQYQLKVDRLDIRNRVYFPGHVRDIVVGKTADNMADCVHLADVGQELVSEPFSF